MLHIQVFLSLTNQVYIYCVLKCFIRLLFLFITGLFVLLLVYVGSIQFTFVKHKECVSAGVARMCRPVCVYSPSLHPGQCAFVCTESCQAASDVAALLPRRHVKTHSGAERKRIITQECISSQRQSWTRWGTPGFLTHRRPGGRGWIEVKADFWFVLIYFFIFYPVGRRLLANSWKCHLVCIMRISKNSSNFLFLLTL